MVGFKADGTSCHTVSIVSLIFSIFLLGLFGCGSTTTGSIFPLSPAPLSCYIGQVGSHGLIEFCQLLGTVGPLMSVHVAIGGECLATKLTGEWPLTGMHQHVTVQGAEGGQHFSAETTVVDFCLACWVIGVRIWLHRIVASDVLGEIFLQFKVLSADWTFVGLLIPSFGNDSC